MNIRIAHCIEVLEMQGGPWVIHIRFVGEPQGAGVLRRGTRGLAVWLVIDKHGGFGK